MKNNFVQFVFLVELDNRHPYVYIKIGRLLTCKATLILSHCISSFFYDAAGINDGTEHAVELAELLRTSCGRGYHVNLIPFNPIEGSEYRRPYKKAVSSRFFISNMLIYVDC